MLDLKVEPLKRNAQPSGYHLGVARKAFSTVISSRMKLSYRRISFGAFCSYLPKSIMCQAKLLSWALNSDLAVINSATF